MQPIVDGASQGVPAHVPAARVARSFPFSFGATTTEYPFDRMVAEVHRGPPVIYVPDFYPGGDGGWVPRRYEDMRAVYLDTEHFSNADTTPFPIVTQAPWRVLPLESDHALHDAYRAILNPLFSPKAVAALSDSIRAYAREYAESFKAERRVDFIARFANEFPIRVFLEMMGLPQQRAAQFLQWTGGLTHAPDVQTLARATNDVVDYLKGVIEERKHSPRDDLVSHAVLARTPRGRALDDDELVGICFNLFVGGLDTVSTNLAWQFLHLAGNPGHQRLLRADPSLIPDAVDEFMRAFAPVTTFRNCVQRTEICGATIMPGDKVALSTTLACHDPAVFENPGDVMLERKPRHVSFGYGPHICLGMHLARREMRIAIEEFLAVIPQFRLVTDVPVTSSLYGIIQPGRVMLEWDA